MSVIAERSVTLVTHRDPVKKAVRRSNRRSRIPIAAAAIVREDVNMAAAGLLYDMASLQGTERSRFGYKRAAKAIVGLPVAVSELVAAGVLRDVSFVGPSSERIITEFLDLGRSPSVEAAVAKAGKSSQLDALRGLRRAFLSHHTMHLALEASLGAGTVARASYRGDFQMHSSWSDGGERIGTMAHAAQALGHSCLGITDHSHGLAIAGGMSMADVVRQHEEIDKLNEDFEGAFRVFKGIEANILPDGGLDLQPEERAGFEFIVASPHSLLRRPEDQTARMLGAVRGAGVTILGHPTGRMYNSRAGVAADWDRVFAEAAKRRVAIEIDGNWHRQDIDFELARRALEAGCLFALDSDAHSPGELRFSDYALAHARLAGIPTDRVINTWSNDQLDEWMAERRRAPGV